MKNFSAESIEEVSYPGNTAEERLNARSSIEYKRLRKTELFLKADRNITIKIESFTDPVVSNLVLKNAKFQDLVEKKKLSKNDILSAYRSVSVLNQLKLEFHILCSQYLPKDRAKIIIDNFNSSIEKSMIQVGNESLRMKDFRF
ncbi:MAG: hypothetical protein ACKO7P_15495 [Bacteroidota bacterium]